MKKYLLFIDFDFTITTDDVGNRFYTYFSNGQNEPLVKKWLNRTLSSFECLTEEAGLCRGTSQEFIEYVNRFEIDAGFFKLLKYCQDSSIPLTVLSDGLDFYIDEVFKKYDLKDVPYYANHAVIGDGGLKIELPFWNPDCPACGNCKGEHIRRINQDGHTVIYIGDGFSDLCGVKEADLVFAKDDLAHYLKEENKDYIEFKNLTEVTEKLRGYISPGNNPDATK